MLTPSFRGNLQVALSKQPLAFLDAKFYTTPELLPVELRYIFQRTWLYVGHSKNLANYNSVMTTEVAGCSILITRTQKGELKAFHNVCTHRASPLQSESGIKPLKCLVCPYHGWVYSLEGELLAAPGQKNFPDFTLEDFPLKPIRIESWGPFMFICLDPSPPPLLEFLGEAVRRMATYPMQQMELLFAKDTLVNCNWKTFHDNGLCDYHVSIAHRKTLKDVQGSERFYQYSFDQYVNLLSTPITPSWQAESRIFEDLPEPLRSEFLTFGIFPNLHIFVLPDTTFFLERIDPLTTNTCRVHTEAYGIPGYSPPTDDLEPWYEALLEEDLVLTEGVQKGYASGAYIPGPINGLETRVIHQQQLIRRFLMAGF